MSNTYNVGWLRDNENQIFIPFTYTKSVKLDDKGNTLDSTVNTVKEHSDVIADINATLEKIKNGEIHSGIADSTKGTLTLGNKKFNGSADITVEAKDLGITGALTYIGISTFPLTDKGIEKPYIDGKEIDTATLEKGSVVLYSNNGEVYQEYLWTGTYWELLGDEGSYAYRSISIEAGAGLTGGGTLADNFSFSVMPDNNTTVIDDDNRVAMKQLSSAGTYGQSTNVQNLEPQSTNEFSVPYFTVDDYGRIISAQTKTIRIINDSAILDDIAQIKADIAGDDGATDNIVPRLAQVETRTKYINASSSEDDNIDESVFQITDDKGNIGVQVDNQGIKSFDFILTKTNTSLVTKLNELDVKDTELADNIKELKGYTLTAGAGLTGGGDLSTNREFHIGKGTGIQVNEDSIQLEAIKGLTTGSYGQSTQYTSGFNGSFEIPHFTVDEFGRITSIKKVTINMPKDEEILDSIDELDDKLTKLVASTKEELQGNINNINNTLDGRITSIYNTLDNKIDSVKSTLDAKDTELADNLSMEIGAINETIADHVTTLLNKIDENKANIESNDQDIAALSQRIAFNEKDIIDINEINIQQSDLLVGHENDIDILQERTKLLNSSDYQDNFYITDDNGNISFQIDENGNISANKSITAEDFITHNNIKLSEVKSALDQEIEDRTTKDSELSDAIDEINGKINKTVGTTTQPIYFNDGTPTACVDNFTFYQEIGADDVDPSTSSTFCVLKTGDTMSGPLISTGFIGPLTGTADAAKKLVDSNNQGLSLGSASNPVYFNGGVPTACTGTTVPTGGSAGQILVKNSDGTSSWQKLVALPEGGSAGQVLVKNSTTDGDASWITQGLALTGDVSGSGLFDSVGNLVITTTVADDSHNHNNYIPYTATGNSDLNTIVNSGFYRLNSNLTNAPTSGDWGQLLVIHGGGDTITQIHGNFSNGNLHTRSGNPSDVGGAGSWSEWKQIWIQGNSVTGAVWNDYAECRESNCEDFGYVLMENGDDTLSKTTKRLSHFAGVSSDTWGFSQGKTDKAKTPIAVAGRVLVYPYQDRNNYKPGDCVCAAPGGTVDIMTREEIINWPDRIVGTVSCVPQYEEWGGGEGADRDPVKVNGRIWIKVK